MFDGMKCTSTVCVNSSCCERSTAKPSKHQLYGDFYCESETRRCSSYWPNEKGRVFDILSTPVATSNPTFDTLYQFQAMGRALRYPTTKVVKITKMFDEPKKST